MPEAANPPAPAPAAPAAVPASTIVPPVTPAPAPAKGSAKSRMFDKLGEYSGGKKPEPKPAEAPAPAKVDDPPAEPKPGEAAAPAAKPGEKPPDKKANPWDLYNKSKETVKSLETRIAELEGKQMKPEQQKEWESKTARLKELEEEIRYTNYQKSTEFQEKYQKPYDQAWKRAMTDLNELTVADGNGGERPMVANDILEIVNMPLKEARALAVQKFGDFADDAMAHRKQIRNLYDEQSNALETVRKEGETRDKQRQEQQQTQMRAVTKEVQETWDSTNEAVRSDEKYGRYFTPVEGDQEGNQRLAKGFELADRAFRENPMMAKDGDERRSIVQRHAAVRNRAAAFGRLVYQNDRLLGELTDTKAKLAKYEGSEPPAGGSTPPKTPTNGGTAQSRLHSALEKFAK